MLFSVYSNCMSKYSSIISVQLVAEESDDSFDSFIIQVRGEKVDDSGNTTFYGQWIDFPQIGELIDCGKYRGAAIVDKGFWNIKQKTSWACTKSAEFAGRPIRFTTLNFTWKAPMRDVGALRIRASVADGNVYRTISSKRIRFETFPVCAHTHNICNTTKKTYFWFPTTDPCYWLWTKSGLLQAMSHSSAMRSRRKWTTGHHGHRRSRKQRGRHYFQIGWQTIFQRVGLYRYWHRLGLLYAKYGYSCLQ